MMGLLGCFDFAQFGVHQPVELPVGNRGLKHGGSLSIVEYFGH